jgi:hypothetical protein
MMMRTNSLFAALLVLGCSGTHDETVPLPEPARVSAITPTVIPVLSAPPPHAPPAPAGSEMSPIRIEIVFLPAPPVSTLPTSLPNVVRSAAPAAIPVPVQPVTEARVIVCGTSWCVHCGNLRRDLGTRGVPHAYVDLDSKSAMTTTDGRYAQEIPANLQNAVPITRVVEPSGKRTWVQGNNAAGVERAYRGLR